LKDLDGDGRADQSNLYVADVDSPRGAVWDHDRLYLVHPPHLSAFIDHNGDGVSDEQKILVKKQMTKKKLLKATLLVKQSVTLNLMEFSPAKK
jgi:hypothetical protein